MNILFLIKMSLIKFLFKLTFWTFSSSICTSRLRFSQFSHLSTPFFSDFNASHRITVSSLCFYPFFTFSQFISHFSHCHLKIAVGKPHRDILFHIFSTCSLCEGLVSFSILNTLLRFCQSCTWSATYSRTLILSVCEHPERVHLGGWTIVRLWFQSPTTCYGIGQTQGIEKIIASLTCPATEEAS